MLRGRCRVCFEALGEANGSNSQLDGAARLIETQSQKVLGNEWHID